MPIEININKKVHEETKNRMRQLGRTKLLSSPALSSIDMVCRRTAPRGRDCRCRLTGITVELSFELALNRRKIARTCFDARRLRTVNCRRINDEYVPGKAHHFKLDEQNVELHERSHIQDVIDRIRLELERALNRPDGANPYVTFCDCKRTNWCRRTLGNMVQNRVASLSIRAYRDLLEHQGATERRPREAQRADLEARHGVGDEPSD